MKEKIGKGKIKTRNKGKRKNEKGRIGKNTAGLALFFKHSSECKRARGGAF